MVSQSELESAIRSKVVSDVSGGCGQAYDVIITQHAQETSFEWVAPLRKQHLTSGSSLLISVVNDLLKEQIAQLHAFSQKTYTSKQYAEMSGAKDTPAPSAMAPAVASTGIASPDRRRPATLDTSTAQRGAKVHHRSTSSNVSIPELILTTDGADAKTGRAASNAPRPLTPSDHPGGSTSFPDMGASISSPGGGSGISRLHYNQITSVEFWSELRDFLEGRLMKDDGSASPSASPGRVRGEAELVKLFEDFLHTQKVHLSASEVAKIRDGTGMFGM